MRRTATCIVLLIGLGASTSNSWSQSVENNQQRRLISVTGIAQVTAEADLAIVRVGYKLYGPDAKTLYGNALATSNAVMQALTSSGIAKSAIESTSQILQRSQPFELQQYPMSSMDRENHQFSATQSWIIRVKPDEAAGALDTAIKAGANESGWIQWIVNDPSALQARAAADAIANAHSVAEQIAQRSGVRLGQLMTVTQNQYQPLAGAIGPISGSTFGMGSGVMMNGAPSQTGQQLAINSRRIEITLSVYASYSIE